MLRLRRREILTIILTVLTAVAFPVISFADSTDQSIGVWSRFLEGLNGIKNYFCSPSTSESPIIIPRRFSPKRNPPPTFKSEGELRQYLECYAMDDERYQKISAEYLPLIQSAARAFELPPTMLACLILRESQFDPLNKSDSGAFGLGQHTEGAVDFITKLVRQRTSADIDELADQATSSVADNAQARQVTLAQSKKDIALAKTKLINNGFRLRWDDYFTDLKSRGFYKPSAKFSAKTPTIPNAKFEIPREITKESLRDPRIAIGATAIYLHYLLTHLQLTRDPNINLSDSPESPADPDTLLIAAGLYNMGEGSGALVLGALKSKDKKEWVQALKKSNEETAGYLISIRNCITPAADKSGDAWKPPMKDPLYSCKPGDKQKVALGPATELPREYENKIKHASQVGPYLRKLAAANAVPTSPKEKEKKKIETRSSKKGKHT